MTVTVAVAVAVVAHFHTSVSPVPAGSGAMRVISTSVPRGSTCHRFEFRTKGLGFRVERLRV